MFRYASALRCVRPIVPFGVRREISESAWNCCKVGKYILIDDVPHKVTKTQQGGRGRGASFVKCTVQNLYSWKNMEKTFKSTDELEIPVITFEEAQFSWFDSMAGEYVSCHCFFVMCSLVYSSSSLTNAFDSCDYAGVYGLEYFRGGARAERVQGGVPAGGPGGDHAEVRRPHRGHCAAHLCHLYRGQRQRRSTLVSTASSPI
jgi:hypothetical protein